MATKKTTATQAAKKPAPAKKSTPKTQVEGQLALAKPSALDAATQILGEAGQVLNCPQLIEDMAAQGYWTSPAGKAPAGTLYAALAKEIRTQAEKSRFVQVARGQFARAAR